MHEHITKIILNKQSKNYFSRIYEFKNKLSNKRNKNMHKEIYIQERNKYIKFSMIGAISGGIIGYTILMTITYII